MFQIHGFFCRRNLESMVRNEGIIPLIIRFIGLCTLVTKPFTQFLKYPRGGENTRNIRRIQNDSIIQPG